jgi:hypothetical protein
MPAEPSSSISGISRTSLWTAWKSVRKALRHSTIRDVVDFVEYDIDPDLWINRLLWQLSHNAYEPRSPDRFLTAKSRGFSRRKTQPAIPDLVLYRAIVDSLYARVRGRQHKHVYFERAQLFTARERAAAQAQATVAQYGSGSASRFLTWLRYEQYRRHLILRHVYPYIVITDITSIPYSLARLPILCSGSPHHRA